MAKQELNVSDSRGKQEYKEVKYTCSKPSCGATQTLRYLLDEKILPVTCCVKCRAGFGVETGQQIMARIGMFPAAARAAA